MYDRSDFNVDTFMYNNKLNEGCCVDFYIVMFSLFVCPVILLYVMISGTLV